MQQDSVKSAELQQMTETQGQKALLKKSKLWLEEGQQKENQVQQAWSVCLYSQEIACFVVCHWPIECDLHWKFFSKP